jgi:hypothetical protein
MAAIDPALVGIISAVTALTASIVGPLVTLYVAKAQIRAAVRSANRQKWIEEFRETIARFCGQVAVATQIHGEIVMEGQISIPASSHILRDLEQLISTATRIRLLVNPTDPSHDALVASVDDLILMFRDRGGQIDLQREAQDRTRQLAAQSLAIIRAEWVRVQKGV